MPSLRKTMIDFLKAEDWHYASVDGTDDLRLAFAGENGEWPVYVHIEEDEYRLTIYSLLETPIDDSQRPAVMEFVTRANYGMNLCCLELSLDNGEVRVRTALDVSEDRLSEGLIAPLLWENMAQMDTYLPGLMAVIKNEATPREAIKMVEE